MGELCTLGSNGAWDSALLPCHQPQWCSQPQQLFLYHPQREQPGLLPWSSPLSYATITTSLNMTFLSVSKRSNLSTKPKLYFPNFCGEMYPYTRDFPTTCFMYSFLVVNFD